MQVAEYKPANLENPSVRRILGAAMQCWTRAGYHGASLKDIAAEAGVAKSLVHYHFASKDHLLIELQAEWCRIVARAVKGRIAAGPPSIAAARAALDQVWASMVATRVQFGFALEVWRQGETNPAVRRRLVEFDGEIRALLASGLRATLGDLPLALPIERLVALVHVGLDGFSLRLYLDDDVAAVRQAFDDWQQLLFAALTPTGGSR
jgi:AcrR family transcriptional regulator